MGAVPPGFALFMWPFALPYAPLYGLVWMRQAGWSSRCR